MKKIGLVLFMFLLMPAVFAAESQGSEPSVLAGIGRLEKRGLEGRVEKRAQAYFTRIDFSLA